MRRLTLIVALVCAVTATAQQKREKVRLEMTASARMALPESEGMAKQLDVRGYWRMAKRIDVGVATGVADYAETLVPLMATARWRIGRETKYVPFVVVDMGGAMALKSKVSGGGCMALGMGVERRVGKSRTVSLTLGYAYQQLRRLKSYEDDMIRTQYTEHVSHNGVMVRVGVSL